jgi:hypothetical protein
MLVAALPIWSAKFRSARLMAGITPRSNPISSSEHSYAMNMFRLRGKVVFPPPAHLPTRADGWGLARTRQSARES